jgi:hypothetical protein
MDKKSRPDKPKDAQTAKEKNDGKKQSSSQKKGK